MIAIIPAAGYATRLGNLTKEKAKHLLEVGGAPIMNHVIGGIETLPVSNVFLVTNDKFYGQFTYWKRSLNTKLHINVLNDGTQSNEDRLGTVGDIWYAIRKCGINDDLLIIAGDNLYYEEEFGYNLKPLYNAFEELKRNAGVVGLYNVETLAIAKRMNQLTFAGERTPLVGEKLQIIKTVEKDPNPKSTVIAVMIEIYPQAVIGCLKDYIRTKENHDKMGDFRGWLVRENKIPFYGYRLPGQWFDIGSCEELEEAQRFYERIKNINGKKGPKKTPN